MRASVAERYLTLGLQLGRHVDGIVDSYFGPPELAAEVESGPQPAPQHLVAEADALLEEIDDGWLRDQLLGVRTFAGVIAGEQIEYADEVERCYGVRPVFTDEAEFAAAHDELERLLPGKGALAERFESWRRSTEVPADRVEAAVASLIEVGRAWTAAHVELPDGEDVELEIVRDKPWIGYCTYLGAYRSRISVNVELPHSAFELIQLTLHETYPGHHAERCLKERRLVHELGLLEETIVLLPTAQSLISEGIAMLAPELLLADSGAAAVTAAGVEFDLAEALDVHRARMPLTRVPLNAALLLYEGGATTAAVQAYAERWALATPERAAHMVRFLEDPTSRSYVVTYSAGLDLCRAYLDEDAARYPRLLGEQVRVGELQTNIRS